MMHSTPATPSQDHRALIWMERNDLLLAILHAEDEGFTETADALMELLRLLEGRDAGAQGWCDL